MSNLCEQIYKDKLQSNLSIDKKLCCGDAGCFNHDTCYYPSILVMCRAIINAGACERGSQPDIKEWNNTLAREFCGNEKNISKHICVSTNSTIHGPDLDGELNWIVNRTSNLGDSCQSCTCCDERKQCIRLPVNCAHACNSTTVLNNCKSLPNQHSKTGTGKEITDDGRLKAPLLYKSEVCDFTVPSNNTNPNGIGTDSGLSTSDKIGIVFGVLSFIVGVIGIIKWKTIKRCFRNFGNSRRQQQ
ncbi:uncharacterized protein OCT59_012332 [Rhizophagus irregularis]|uniref:Uncharacterized protein n=2 Tax=Rhizophagus irregularis TaxID=588596 RepID=A0A015K1F0_RHIIW|nr:hypothetical protein GLOIN_2v1762975 [Rhizophagus irregularis DAOM 181602=DAOM 197198]EXX61194.1 hypothetical protein RirG_173450 [Rhizophagus irregularis DAOM 197198w]POG81732.1 hypothetical protein GLOIN_2v1762975 [Rhizophagus irregularis DAOM 181602=DAOM 197198]UZO01228.1 hypothetical protein OCT59_012332 [Rhizophagus irregularis]GBC40247.2 hypothetical protein GLOIN_2v1762975 [Rhizophagus irregularis DAOM 181602=DAOM 197198]|eukprot:XP_025188598.1 hypothetical protein GLOIN_2v1762975 [Rhizophagus irregularis DAOM 181602=DAOM 197198]